MPNIQIRGVVLGLRSRDYDFNDDSGNRVNGTSHTLLVHDFRRVETTEVKVPQTLMGLTTDLYPGALVELMAGVFSRNNKATFTLTDEEKPEIVGEYFQATGTA